MKIGKVRSYSEVVERVNRVATRSKGVTLFSLGEIRSDFENYPIYSLRLSSTGTQARQKPVVSLSAGIHGDEPAGVEAMLIWLESPDRYGPFLSYIDFLIFPCINPYGYEHSTRTNSRGLDLNRKFDRKRPPQEVDFVKRALDDKKFDLSMEFHEDVDTRGFYLYEIKEGRPYFGEEIIHRVAEHCPINHQGEIEGLPSSGGIIRPPTEKILNFRRRDWPQAIYQFRNGARHCITCETPVNLTLKERAHLHLIALNTALKKLTER